MGSWRLRLIRESYDAFGDVHWPIFPHQSSEVDGLLSLHCTMKGKKAIYPAGVMRRYGQMDIHACFVRFSNQPNLHDPEPQPISRVALTCEGHSVGHLSGPVTLYACMSVFVITCPDDVLSRRKYLALVFSCLVPLGPHPLNLSRFILPTICIQIM